MTLPGRGYAHIPRHKQLHRHDPAEGLIGDCWRTCIACLMGLKPTEVPHFVADSWDNPNKEAYRAEALAWLAKRNLTIIEIVLVASDIYSCDRFRGVPYILTGMSPNFPDICHAVIGHGNFQVLHDPAASGKGLLGPVDVGQMSDYPGHYFLEFLVPLILPQMVKDTETASWAQPSGPDLFHDN